jgi:phosphoglycerol transferase MdoB-like AlkP superfamily enzyme
MIYQGDGISKLASDAGVLLVAPILFLCFGLGNAMLPQNRADSGFRTRLVLALALLFVLFAICTVVIQDRAILISLWQESPILYSFMYSIAGILGILGVGALFHWKLKPKLWRENRRERNN